MSTLALKTPGRGRRLALWAGLLAAAAACSAQAGTPMPPPGYVDSGSVMRVELNGAGPAAQSLNLGRGKSALVELPVDARDVMVTDPKVADAVLRTPRTINILGVATGQTDAVFFDGMGRRILSLNIRVDQDSTALGETLARVLPRSHIQVEAVNNSIILSGVVDNAGDASAAQHIAEQFVDKPEHVLNMISISGQEQVMLKVRIVEVQRNSIKQLGVGLNALIGNTGGNFQLAGTQAASFGTNGAPVGGLGIGAGYIDHNTGDKFNATLQAFERVGLIRTLAEPNLTAISGESAKFLAGGEFPVPVGRDNNGLVTIEFKPYGVGLGFTPVVLSDGRISLKISTEVSELTNEGAFTLSEGTNTPALVLPALNVRRAQTTVELPSGGAMMIAGLLQSKNSQSIDAVPGLGDLPVIGALFRSRDFQNGDTELVVIVTPYLVQPTSPANLQTPADGLQIASDGQAILMGRLNKVTRGGAAAVAGRTYQGPYGYVIE